jgi:hypothetical protein
MTPESDHYRLEERLERRIDLLHEQHVADLRELERRIDARIVYNTARIAELEGWRNQMLGASKAGRFLWAGIAALLFAAFTLVTWLYEHLLRR